MRLRDRLEYATAQDPARNYCLWDYRPPAPAEDKFRSINLLFQSFDHAGIDARAYGIVDAIRDGIGPFRTVFGVKWVGGRLAWEFYFYDYRRKDREVSMTRVLAAIRGYVAAEVRPNEGLPYFMFSLDLNDAIASGRSPLDIVHMYIGNPGSSVSSGIAYGVRAASVTLENFYFFFDAHTQMDEIAKKIGSSAYFDGDLAALERILVSELRDCATICIANKQTHDCIYFSGVAVDQLLWFLRWLDYPGPVVDFVASNRRELDHLLFDVGFDYRLTDGTLNILKSGYYGVF